jgi:hypothetical protein
MTTELAKLVSRVALNMSDRPIPTAVEILRALNELAEEAEKLGYARGVAAGSNHIADSFTRILGAV